MKSKEWERKKLGDVINLKRGYDLPLKKRTEGPYSILSSSGVTGSHNEYKIKGPGVVTGRSGQLGKVFYTDEDYWPLNTTLYVEDFKSSDPKFIYYLLQTLNFENFNAGSSVPTLNRNHVHLLDVHVPPIRQQKSIGQLLYLLEEKVAANSLVIKNLEQLAQTLFKRWFVDFEFPNENGEPYKSSGGKMMESEIGEIPEAFYVKKLQEYGEFKNGINYSRDSKGDRNYKVCNVRNIVTQNILDSSFLDEISVDEKKAAPYKVKPGDILIVRSASPGETTYVNSVHSDVIFSGFVIRLRPVDMKESFYLYFRLHGLKNQLDSYSTGTTLKNLNQQILKSLPIIQPDTEVIEKFNAICAPVFNKIESVNNEMNQLKILRDTLLPKLLSGEIELPDESVVTEDDVLVQ